MAQKRIKMVRQDILGDQLRLLYDDGTQGILEYGGRFPFQNSYQCPTGKLCRAHAQAGQDETWY